MKVWRRWVSFFESSWLSGSSRYIMFQGVSRDWWNGWCDFDLTAQKGFQWQDKGLGWECSWWWLAFWVRGLIQVVTFTASSIISQGGNHSCRWIKCVKLGCFLNSANFGNLGIGKFLKKTLRKVDFKLPLSVRNPGDSSWINLKKSRHASDPHVIPPWAPWKIPRVHISPTILWRNFFLLWVWKGKFGVSSQIMWAKSLTEKSGRSIVAKLITTTTPQV